MNHKNRDTRIDCPPCNLPTQERLNYFTGQFLAERDFRDEQLYLLGKQRQHNRYLHGWGTVCGLKVVQHPNEACRDRFVVLQPGMALDCCGREIVVQDKDCIDLVKELPQTLTEQSDDCHLLISLCYCECKTEFVPALYSDCGCDETGCEANRIHEGYEIKVQLVDQLPEPKVTDPAVLQMKWNNTLPVANAKGLALDETRNRLYVLTTSERGRLTTAINAPEDDAENPAATIEEVSTSDFGPIFVGGRRSQIQIYDTRNSLHIGSIDLEVEALQIVIDRANDYLFVLFQERARGATKKIRAYSLTDWDQSHDFDDLPLASKGEWDHMLIADENRLYLLESEDGVVRAWDSVIDSNASPGTNLEFQRFTEVDDLVRPTSIALSKDQRWIFVAELGEKSTPANSIKCFEINPEISEPESIFGLIYEEPRFLRTGGDENNLYSITFSPSNRQAKIRFFNVESCGLTEIGNGIELNLENEDIRDVQISPTGRWIYVLLVARAQDRKGCVRAYNTSKTFERSGNVSYQEYLTVSNPTSLLVTSDGKKVYVAGEEGVSILEVSEQFCQDIVWNTLEECPECSDDACVPLAFIENGRDDQRESTAITDDKINNRIRPIVTSTETLRKMVLCALEAGLGKQGLKGEPGAPGENGRGFEEGLTTINALSWEHNQNSEGLIPIYIDDQTMGLGIAIGFSNEVYVTNQDYPVINAEYVFQVLFDRLRNYGSDNFTSYINMPGKVLPAEGYRSSRNSKKIDKAKVINKTTSNGIVFVILQYRENESGEFELFQEGYYRNAPDVIRENIEAYFMGSSIKSLWIKLRGDFIIDKNKKAINAKFLRAELPTGTFAKNHGPQIANPRVGIQGGLFESWFFPKEPVSNWNSNMNEYIKLYKEMRGD
jgi:DNA-binding beta-propeller fold protein YncE